MALRLVFTALVCLPYSSLGSDPSAMVMRADLSTKSSEPVEDDLCTHLGVHRVHGEDTLAGLHVSGLGDAFDGDFPNNFDDPGGGAWFPFYTKVQNGIATQLRWGSPTEKLHLVPVEAEDRHRVKDRWFLLSDRYRSAHDFTHLGTLHCEQFIGSGVGTPIGKAGIENNGTCDVYAVCMEGCPSPLLDSGRSYSWSEDADWVDIANLPNKWPKSFAGTTKWQLASGDVVSVSVGCCKRKPLSCDNVDCSGHSPGLDCDSARCCWTLEEPYDCEFLDFCPISRQHPLPICIWGPCYKKKCERSDNPHIMPQCDLGSETTSDQLDGHLRNLDVSNITLAQAPTAFTV